MLCSHAIGLVLADSPIRDEFKCIRNKVLVPVTAASKPFMGGIEDFSAPCSWSGGVPAKMMSQGMFDRLQHHWRLEVPSMFDAERPSLASLAYFPLKIMATEWLNYIAVMASNLKSYEASTKQAPNLLRQLDQLGSDLLVL